MKITQLLSVALLISLAASRAEALPTLSSTNLQNISTCITTNLTAAGNAVCSTISTSKKTLTKAASDATTATVTALKAAQECVVQNQQQIKKVALITAGVTVAAYAVYKFIKPAAKNKKSK